MKRSLHLGLNAVLPAAYHGWPGELMACVNDATSNAALFAQHGFEAVGRFNHDCSLAGTRASLAQLGAELKADAQLVLSFSGHGGRAAGWSWSGYTETLCFWDGQMADTELHSLLTYFSPGVKVIVILDSCHSGGMDRGLALGLALGGTNGPALRPRNIPRWLNDQLPAPALPTARGEIQCSALLLTACRADEVALDGYTNGAFTGAMLRARENFGHVPTWAEWFTATAELMLAEHASQHPTAKVLGPDTIWHTKIDA